MVTGVVGVAYLLLLGILCLVADVECSWAWEWDRDNYSPIHRHSRIPHVGVRRSIYDRFWGETTPNNPFLPTRPSAPQVLPRLSENDFFTRDDEYDEDLGNAHWFPQMIHSGQQTKTLEELQHLLEGKLGPINNAAPSRQHKTPVIVSHKDEKEKKQRTKQTKYRQHFSQESAPFSSKSDRSGPSPGRGENLSHLTDFGTGAFTHDGHLVADDQQYSKDILRDFQEPLSMQEHFTNSKQFPKDFISPDQLPRDFGVQESNDHLTTDPFVSELENQESPFQQHILLSPIQNSDFQSADHLLNLHSDQTLGEVDLPQIFPDLGLLGNIDQEGSFLHQDSLGHFDMPNSQSPDILPETGDGLEWLPPSLSELNLPSHNQMISSLEQQKLSKEAHRDACHARNLHSCGSRLIDEFAFGPDNPDKCRIREEFLDCMEQVMKLPCELHGERYSREGTKLIRDKIKTLLWSAQGCILGYST